MFRYKDQFNRWQFQGANGLPTPPQLPPPSPPSPRPQSQPRHPQPLQWPRLQPLHQPRVMRRLRWTPLLLLPRARLRLKLPSLRLSSHRLAPRRRCQSHLVRFTLDYFRLYSASGCQLVVASWASTLHLKTPFSYCWASFSKLELSSLVFYYSAKWEDPEVG